MERLKHEDWDEMMICGEAMNELKMTVGNRCGANCATAETVSRGAPSTRSSHAFARLAGRW